MINKETIKLIKENKKCKTMLALRLDKSVATIYRYIDSNDIMLTTDIALNTIQEFTGLERKDMLDADMFINANANQLLSNAIGK